MRKLVMMLFVMLFVMVGCQFDDTLEIEGPDAGASERVSLPDPGDEHDLDEADVFYQPGEALSCNANLGNHCTFPDRVCCHGSCSPYPVTTNPDQKWCVLGWIWYTGPGPDMWKGVKHSSCIPFYENELFEGWHPGDDLACGAGDPTCTDNSKPQFGWNIGPDGVPCNADDIDPTP